MPYVTCKYVIATMQGLDFRLLLSFILVTNSRGKLLSCDQYITVSSISSLIPLFLIFLDTFNSYHITRFVFPSLWTERVLNVSAAIGLKYTQRSWSLQLIVSFQVLGDFVSANPAVRDGFHSAFILEAFVPKPLRSHAESISMDSTQHSTWKHFNVTTSSFPNKRYCCVSLR